MTSVIYTTRIFTRDQLQRNRIMLQLAMVSLNPVAMNLSLKDNISASYIFLPQVTWKKEQKKKNLHLKFQTAKQFKCMSRWKKKSVEKSTNDVISSRSMLGEKSY